jgi:hypothetical protein
VGGDPALYEIDYPFGDWTAYFWVFYGPVDQALLRSLVAGFAPIGDQDPSAWPSSPFE